jgi:hypothetical protein
MTNACLFISLCSDIQVLILNIHTVFQGKLSASGFIAASHLATIHSTIAAVPPPTTDVLLLDIIEGALVYFKTIRASCR